MEGSDAFDDDEAAVGELVSSLRTRSPGHVRAAAVRVASRIAAAEREDRGKWSRGGRRGGGGGGGGGTRESATSIFDMPADVLTKIVIGMSMVLDRARVELARSCDNGGDQNVPVLFDSEAMVAVFDSVKDLARDTVLEGDLVRSGALGSVVSILLSVGNATSTVSDAALSLAAISSGLDALANLTTASAHAAVAHEFGALPYVCKCLEDGLARAAASAPSTITGSAVEKTPDDVVTQRLLEGAVSVVRNLSAAPHDLRPLVVAHGAIGSLVNLVTTFGLDTDVCSDAIAALLNVSTHDLADAALRDNGVAPVLLECVGDCVAGIELQDFQAERRAAGNSSDVNSGDFEDDDDETRDRIAAATLALRTARNMCASEPGSQFFSNRAALNILSRAQKIALSGTPPVSTSSSRSMQHAASLVLVLQSVTEVLENVAIFADANVCSDLLSLGTIASLTETIGRGSSDAKSSAADALASLISVDDRVSEAIKMGAGGALLYSMIEMRARERERAEDEVGEGTSNDDDEESESEDEEDESEGDMDDESEGEEEQEEEGGGVRLRPRRAPPRAAAFGSTPVRPRPTAAFGRSARPSPADNL